MDLESKSVKELRELAKQKGLTNYSKLTKEKLIRLLAEPTGGKKTAGSGNKAPPARPVLPTDGRNARAAAESPAQSAAPPSPQPGDRVYVDEIQVEEAKYALTPPGIPEVVHAEGADLGEDIDTLPPISEALLCLLPQKPGILHAYWVLDPPMLQRKEGLKLRLTRLADQGVEPLQEFAVMSASGHWYLHLPQTEDPGELFLQLGHYTAEGQFITTLRRGTVRVPTLGAAGRTDPRWWFSDEQFREMYLRAGGYMRGAQLGWAGPAASSR